MDWLDILSRLKKINKEKGSVSSTPNNIEEFFHTFICILVCCLLFIFEIISYFFKASSN